MSKALIHQYYKEVEEIIRLGKTRNEGSVSIAMHTLLQQYARSKSLVLIHQNELLDKNKKGNRMVPDGMLRTGFGLNAGLWESKDTKDDLDEEIKKKLAVGYTDDNILFENSRMAVLIQDGRERVRCNIEDATAFDAMLASWVTYRTREVREFDQAIEEFKLNIPLVTDIIKADITASGKTNNEFVKARNQFLELCRESINPEVNLDDVNEMILQHILTAEIFTSVFADPHFHHENNIARELEEVIERMWRHKSRKQVVMPLEKYYEVIRASAARIADHQEKQRFLKMVYENFYKSYNPKAADRLGVVYTPNEVVRFMIETTDKLLWSNFKMMLEDEKVEILDPATGTGTFICDIINHIRPSQLKKKFQNEIHANELAILPYYIANLNIEYTYKQKMNEYLTFENLCFVDTLENLGFKGIGRQQDMFSITAENAARIKKQNEKKISVIIGNPPYNAKQENYNFQNANKTYKHFDDRIKETYVKHGTAQNQIVLYDMYVRFFRWAADRVCKNGIVAFVSNSSFIDGKTFDGFRKCAADEFSEIYIVNLKGNARTSGERRRMEGGNVFSDEIRVGVAVYFFIRNETKEGCKIYYNEVGDYVDGEDKKKYLSEHTFDTLTWTRIQPDKNHNWINQSDNDFEELVPLIDKEVKAGKSEMAVFGKFTYGFDTKADSYLFSHSKSELTLQMKHFIEVFNLVSIKNNHKRKYEIKWSRNVERKAHKGVQKKFEATKITIADYRPYKREFVYMDEDLIAESFLWFHIHEKNRQNLFIAISGPASVKPFQTLATPNTFCGDFLEKTQGIPRFWYSKDGIQQDNITDWALHHFAKHYGLHAHPAAKDKSAALSEPVQQRAANAIDFPQPHLEDNRSAEVHEAAETYTKKTKHVSLREKTATGQTISKENIFHYCYAVLHNPAYRQKYEQNLKREFPRIPLYADFHKWAAWGKELMDLHINYETAKPMALKVATTKSKLAGRVKLKANKEEGTIELDELTIITGIPAEAWNYKLGNRSALEWVLDQYKEKKPTDPTIAEKFNTYRFADYKDTVIDLIKRVTTVSVETQRLVCEMEQVNSEAQVTMH